MHREVPRIPGGPELLVGPQPPMANWTVWVFPSTIMPAATIFSTRVAV